MDHKKLHTVYPVYPVILSKITSSDRINRIDRIRNKIIILFILLPCLKSLNKLMIFKYKIQDSFAFLSRPESNARRNNDGFT